MPHIWGWGPFSITAQGEEVLLGDRARDAFRRHRVSFDSPSSEDLLSAISEMNSAVEELWASVARRVESEGTLEIPRGGDVKEVLGSPKMTLIETKEVPLVRNLIEASLIASTVGIEYEMRGARLESARLPTEVRSPAFWEVLGKATETATHRSVSDFGLSDEFDPADRNAVEAAFLVAATRAYVNAVQGIAPFLPRNDEQAR
jgi:hypothetical protein